MGRFLDPRIPAASAFGDRESFRLVQIRFMNSVNNAHDLTCTLLATATEIVVL